MRSWLLTRCNRSLEALCHTPARVPSCCLETARSHSTFPQKIYDTKAAELSENTVTTAPAQPLQCTRSSIQAGSRHNARAVHAQGHANYGATENSSRRGSFSVTLISGILQNATKLKTFHRARRTSGSFSMMSCGATLRQCGGMAAFILFLPNCFSLTLRVKRSDTHRGKDAKGEAAPQALIDFQSAPTLI